jgi:hypothetical protein
MPWNNSCRMTSRDYPGQHQYVTMGRWTQNDGAIAEGELFVSKYCDGRTFGVGKVAIRVT